MKRFLHSALHSVLHSVLRLLWWLARVLVVHVVTPVSKQHTSNRPRILLIRSGHLGDLVMTTPALQSLKTHVSEAEITLIVATTPSEIVARHPAVDELIACPLPSSRGHSPRSIKSMLLLLRLARQLRRGHYDLAINLRAQFWWGSILLYLAGIPQRIGYAVEPSTPLLTRAIPREPHEHVTAASLRLISAGLQALGLQPLEEPYTPQKYPLSFVPTSQEEQWVRQYLREDGIDDTTQLIVIHPGAGTALKQWRPEGWAQCATMLTQHFSHSPDVRIILTGTEKERPLLETVAKETAARTTLLTSASIGQFASLLKRADLVLGVDSGPLHLAVSQSTPTIQLFASTDPRVYGPWGPQAQHRIVVSRYRCLSCSAIPCGRLDVPSNELAEHPCVRKISEQDVLATIEELMPQWCKSKI